MRFATTADGVATSTCYSDLDIESDEGMSGHRVKIEPNVLMDKVVELGIDKSPGDTELYFGISFLTGGQGTIVAGKGSTIQYKSVPLSKLRRYNILQYYVETWYNSRISISLLTKDFTADGGSTTLSIKYSWATFGTITNSDSSVCTLSRTSSGGSLTDYGTVDITVTALENTTSGSRESQITIPAGANTLSSAFEGNNFVYVTVKYPNICGLKIYLTGGLTSMVNEIDNIWMTNKNGTEIIDSFTYSYIPIDNMVQEYSFGAKMPYEFGCVNLGTRGLVIHMSRYTASSYFVCGQNEVEPGPGLWSTYFIIEWGAGQITKLGPISANELYNASNGSGSTGLSLNANKNGFDGVIDDYH